ncbi:MAG TPA: hypothetical protein VMS88_03590 [Terriglobales bacterium]|nr:hypothetical protein [Terriglobales bacterium]
MVTYLILFLAFLVLGYPLRRVLVALAAGRAVGKAALQGQPDRIELREANLQSWKDPDAAQRLTEPLILLGYEQAGSFTVPQLPGVVVRLLVHVRECVLACVYEHPRAGHWVELVTRYVGGTSFTVTGSPDSGLAPRPGHTVIHLPGTAPAALHERLLASRPPSGKEEVDASRARRNFEEAFAEGMAWRKSHGVSTGEVVKIAVHPIRKQKAA